jgi:hypothetical protein
MKRILFVLVLVCLVKALHAQTPRTPYVYTIKADSVKITNTCDTAELIIENHTQTVPGFLFNKGRGRTEFRRISQFNDTSVVIGGDTIHLGRGYKNFANANLTYDGNHFHNGAFHGMSLTDFSSIGFKSNNTNGSKSTEITMDPNQGYNLNVNNTTDPENLRQGVLIVDGRDFIGGVATTTADISQFGQLSMGDVRIDLNTTTNDLNTGDWKNAGVAIGYLTDFDPVEVDLYAKEGTMRLYTTNEIKNNRIEMNFNRGEYLTTYCGKNDIGSSGVIQTPRGFTFSANGPLQSPLFLDFRLTGLPVSTNSQDSVLVISDSGQVRKQAQSSLTPALNIIQGDIVDITAAVDAVTKLPNLQSHAGHSVSLPPAANYAGKKIYIWNQNASVNVWTFASSITLPDGTTSNTIPNQSTIELLSDGNVWIKWK